MTEAFRQSDPVLFGHHSSAHPAAAGSLDGPSIYFSILVAVIPLSYVQAQADLRQ